MIYVFVVRIGDLKKKLNLIKDEDIKLFNNTVFLYELSEYNGNSLPNMNINMTAASILYSEFHADINTIVSALIYRIVKKLNIPDKEVLRLFNEDIRSKVDLLVKFDEDLYSVSDNNHLQMITSLTKDVKVPIIKLIERTISFNFIKKSKNNSRNSYVDDTLDFYVPISKLLGIYIVKNELEDACFKYNNGFSVASNIIKEVNKEYKSIIKYVNALVESENIGLTSYPEFKINRKSGYDIYRKADEAQIKKMKKKDYNLLGFCSVKCLLENKEDCYKIIYLLHKFKQIFGSFNDYVGGSQGNEYHAIHTSVFIKNHVVDFKICTKEMDYVNYYGITSSWKENPNLQERLLNNYDFYPILICLEKNLLEEELVNAFIENIIEAKELKGEYFDLDMQKFLPEEKRNVK